VDAQILLREFLARGLHRIDEYPAYNFGAAGVFEVGPAMSATRNKLALGAALMVLLALLGATAGGAGATSAIGPARVVERFAPRQLVVKFAGEPNGRTVGLPRGAGVLATARALRAKPDVEYAQPNFAAHASAVETEPTTGPDPDDPGTLEAPAIASTATVGGWALKQWDFLDYSGTGTTKLPTSPGGIDAIGAWANLEAAGRPGAQGVIVAVLDSGIAYRDFGTKYVRSPDFSPEQFVPGEDFVDKDHLPLDENGHGTHVAGTIAEQTNNGVGLTGLAYNAKLMPVRVLNQANVGYANRIAAGIRFAVTHHAQVINMSFNFGCGEKVPQVDEALREAYDHGVVTVASGGNLSPATSSAKSCVSEPATGPRVIGVGGTTEGACIGSYSLAGKGIDVVAPGGGPPAAGCPSILSRPIYQVTLKPGTTNQFTIPTNYAGTSMAAAHVSGTVAMILASGVIPAGLKPKARVRAVTKRLEVTARSLGYPATVQGHGLIDAARATAATP
jgi:serine protease